MINYVENVEDFLGWHGSLLDILEECLKEFPDVIEKYMQMEKVDAIEAI